MAALSPLPPWPYSRGRIWTCKLPVWFLSFWNICMNFRQLFCLDIISFRLASWMTLWYSSSSPCTLLSSSGITHLYREIIWNYVLSKTRLFLWSTNFICRQIMANMGENLPAGINQWPSSDWSKITTSYFLPCVIAANRRQTHWKTVSDVVNFSVEIILMKSKKYYPSYRFLVSQNCELFDNFGLWWWLWPYRHTVHSSETIA